MVSVAKETENMPDFEMLPAKETEKMPDLEVLPPTLVMPEVPETEKPTPEDEEDAADRVAVLRH